MTAKIQVKVQQGVVEGEILKTKSGFSYASFTGIPFAKPPVGDLKFRDPVPVEKWSNVLDATKEMKICAQMDLIIKKYVGEEDCLYLNVYVPEGVKKGDKLAVMFWVHGGGYLSGSGSTDYYGPDHLIPNNIVLVTINYRVGALGFICLDIEEAPGNMGLKDQALALKWVYDNIEEFGGDAKNITLFGESAGGSAVNNLMLTPLTKGMFKQAIMQSGTSVCEWSVPDDVIKSTFELGEQMGLKTTDKKELIQFLKTVPVEKLQTAAVSIGVHLTFAPVAEKVNIPNVRPFFTEDPRLMMIKGNFHKVPVMVGSTSNEGVMFIYFKAEELGIGKDEKITLSKCVPDFKKYVPAHLLKKFDEKKVEKAAQKIKEFYFPNDEDILDKYMDFQSDFAFIKDINFVAKLFAQHSKTYCYNFAYKGALNITQALFQMPYKGASHGDDLGYLFIPKSPALSTDNLEITERDIAAVKRMTTLWTNFAKYGNPVPKLSDTLPIEWKPVTKDKFMCLQIDDNLTMVEDPYKKRVQFWESLENL